MRALGLRPAKWTGNTWALPLYNVQLLRFNVGDKVLCKMAVGWEPGTITQQHYVLKSSDVFGGSGEDFQEGDVVPYEVELLGGAGIWCPFDNDASVRRPTEHELQDFDRPADSIASSSESRRLLTEESKAS